MAGQSNTQNVTQVSFSKFVEHMKKFFNNVEVDGDAIVTISINNYYELHYTTASVFNGTFVLFLTEGRWIRFIPRDGELLYTFDGQVYFSITADFSLYQKKDQLKIIVSWG